MMTCPENNPQKLSSRKFIGSASAALAGFTIVPSHAVSGLGHIAPSDKLNIAVVGIGGMGNANLKAVSATENIVALCDVDWGYAKKVFEENPNAKRYWDWRRMYDELGQSIDAVIVATSDHTHCIIAAHAITLGKHVYVQKPLSHSVYESRLLTRLAEKYKVATQMGNQRSSGEAVNLAIEWIQNGEIGEVRKVDSFTDRPIWPQGLNTPKGEWVPETLDWDLFVGPARIRPYSSIYTPWNWRGWWDFGTGTFGDMACHIMHPIFKSLRLQYPVRIQGSSTTLLQDCAPNAQMVHMTFPEREAPKGSKIKYPEVQVTWYDGGLQPPKPDGWPAGKSMNISGGCAIFYGSKDILVCGGSSSPNDPFLLSGRVPVVPKTERRVEVSHEMDWVRACKESPKNRVRIKSDFSEAGPFNEMVLMGVLAIRLQGLNKELEWDGEKMEFVNIDDNDTLKICISDDFSIVDGDPRFDKKWTDPINAKQFASELIRHTYRDNWTLPDMPSPA